MFDRSLCACPNRLTHPFLPPVLLHHRQCPRAPPPSRAYSGLTSRPNRTHRKALGPPLAPTRIHPVAQPHFSSFSARTKSFLSQSCPTRADDDDHLPPSSARTRGCSVAADIRMPLTILPSHHGVIYARSLARSTICRAPTTAEIGVMVRPLHTHMKTTRPSYTPFYLRCHLKRTTFPRLPLVTPHTGGTHQFPARCASVVSFHVIVRRPRVWARAATRRCRVVAARDAATRGECGRPQREAAWRPPLRRARSVQSNAACAQP